MLPTVLRSRSRKEQNFWLEPVPQGAETFD
jgi:hypothetical protein